MAGIVTCASQYEQSFGVILCFLVLLVLHLHISLRVACAGWGNFISLLSFFLKNSVLVVTATSLGTKY